MSSGYPGGGPDFYNSGRSINNGITSNVSQSPYRSQIFLEPGSQIVQQRTTPATTPPSLIGKRTLTEFQNHQFNNLLMRSVKPRMYQNTSPISTLSPIELSGNMSGYVPFSPVTALTHRYGLPPLQQLKSPSHQFSQFNSAGGVPYLNNFQKGVINMGYQQESSEKKMLNRLHELEKQLLDDNDDEEDAVSIITNTNSEWSETIESLISSSSPTAISLSPTNSSTSSSSSLASSATTAVSNCSKELVIEAATAIYEGKSESAKEILMRLSQFTNAKGNSEQRLMEYLLLALKSRANSLDTPPPVAELYSKEHVGSIQELYEVSPCFKLGFMAVNLAIVDATLEEPNIKKFHVVDFDIGQGGQYVHLLHAISSRHIDKPSLFFKVTAVSENGSEERLKKVGDMLSNLAEQVGVSFNFNVVVNHKLTDLTRYSLGCEPEEPLAVNFAFNLYRMPDESVSTENLRDELLRRVKKLSPRVVTMVEQEMNTNTAPFLARVGEMWSYYGALFESIDSTNPRDSHRRFMAEEGLGRKLANSVACEGRDRLERCEVFGKWRARMGMAGFKLKPMSSNVAESMRIRLNSGIQANPGFTIKEDNGSVCFGWMGRTITVASAWR